jgi:hypothetical protein
MKFEIINPSDEAYIEGTFEACAIATLLFGEGFYALKEVGGTNKMPLMLSSDPNPWLIKQFAKSFRQLYEENKEAIADAFLSVHLVREASSLNDLVSDAHELGNILKEKIKKERKVNG